MLLLLAAALPTLLWDSPVDTAPQLRDAGVTHIVVPLERAASWKGVPGITAEGADLNGAIKLPPPSVQYRQNQASASRVPWLVSNGWQFIRRPQGRFYYDAPGKQAALAAAEAFSYGSPAMIRTDRDGLVPLAQMLAFLQAHAADNLTPVADIGYIDDGSAISGEVMNLMVRSNLLFRVVPAADRRLKLNVQLGAKEYPLADARNPAVMAQIVRGNLTDEKRSVRVYGSLVVVARLTGDAGHARVHLLNYAGVDRKVEGIRVRVLGRFDRHQVAAAGMPGAELLDFTADSEATEFTLPELKSYAVVDLFRSEKRP